MIRCCCCIIQLLLSLRVDDVGVFIVFVISVAKWNTLLLDMF